MSHGICLLFAKHTILGRLVCALGLLLATAAPGLSAGQTRAPKTVRLLSIGNSFSLNATHYLGDIAAAEGDVLVHHALSVGGASLEFHWRKFEAHEHDPKSAEGLYPDGRSLKDELLSAHWDYVTIQQASFYSHDISTYRPFARQLRDLIHHLAPDAEVLMHQTWEYRYDDPNRSLPPDKMYPALKNAYASIARELGLRLIPVGDAFHLINADPKNGFQTPLSPIDPSKLKYPQLPAQPHSLNWGWQWKQQPDGTMALLLDGHHANTAGEYLGACVWYEVLFGRSAQGNSFVPIGLDPAYAKFLQDTAHQAVLSADGGGKLTD
jgi:hypothetical protein